MRRRTFVKTAALASVGALFPVARASGADKVVAKMATVAPEGTPWADQLKRFKQRVEAGTEGRVSVKGYLGGGLGDENVTAGEVKRGSIQLWGGSTGALATVVPELALFELPYLFRTYDEADHVIDRVLFADMERLLGSRGLQVVFWAENGYRSFGTTFGPVRTPADLRGKKMRSQESEVHIEMYRAFGAAPVPIAVTEVLSSLQTKVVDGFDNTPLFTFAASWYQGIKDYSLAEAIYQPALVVANKAWFDKLQPEDRRVLVADAEGEAKRGRIGVRELAPLLIDNFRAAKINVHSLTDTEKHAFEKLAEPVHDKWIAGKGKAAAPLVTKAKAALAKYRKEKG
jgi:TRAP-type C4-dicarboxylate transport system substrate-binding protein